MANEMKPKTSSGSNWIGIVAALAAAAVLIGMLDSANIEVFGVSLGPVLVGVVLYLLGFFAGMFNRRRG